MQYFGCNARGLEVFLSLENLGSSSCVIIDHYQKSYQQLRLEDETHARAAGFLGTGQRKGCMEQLLWATDRPRSNELTLVVLDSRGGRNKMYVNGSDVGGSGLVDRRTEARVAIPRSLLFPGHARRADLYES